MVRKPDGKTWLAWSLKRPTLGRGHPDKRGNASVAGWTVEGLHSARNPPHELLGLIRTTDVSGIVWGFTSNRRKRKAP